MTRAERNSLPVLTEDSSVSPEEKKRKGQLDCLSSVEDKYVGIASIILKAIPKMGGLETSEPNPVQGTSRLRWDRREILYEYRG